MSSSHRVRCTCSLRSLVCDLLQASSLRWWLLLLFMFISYTQSTMHDVQYTVHLYSVQCTGTRHNTVHLSNRKLNGVYNLKTEQNLIFTFARSQWVGFYFTGSAGKYKIISWILFFFRSFSYVSSIVPRRQLFVVRCVADGEWVCLCARAQCVSAHDLWQNASDPSPFSRFNMSVRHKWK